MTADTRFDIPLTLQEVAIRCQVGVDTVWAWIKDGRLKAGMSPERERIGRVVMATELRRFMKQHGILKREMA